MAPVQARSGAAERYRELGRTLPQVLGAKLRSSGCLPARTAGEGKKAHPEEEKITCSTIQRGNVMLIQPYLYFDGRCEEALGFYGDKLGAKVEVLMRFNEAPAPHPPGM